MPGIHLKLKESKVKAIDTVHHVTFNMEHLTVKVYTCPAAISVLHPKNLILFENCLTYKISNSMQ